jgi:hypothetical protein
VNAARPRYEYRVVTANGAGVFGTWHKSLGKAKAAAVRLAEQQMEQHVKFGPFEIERSLQLSSGRCYWMRQRKRWILWDPHKDSDARNPDFLEAPR